MKYAWRWKKVEMYLTNRNMRAIVIPLFALLFLSGCFIVKGAERGHVASALGPSTWPVVSGIYSVTIDGDTKDPMTARRKIARDGSRVYVEDVSPGNFFAFYPRQDGYYIVESYDATKHESWYSYARVYEGNVVGSYDSVCGDLTKAQRQNLFGDPEASSCLASNSIELLILLNMSFNQNTDIETVYRLQRQVTDALN